jgi:hypothetical protein
VAAIPAPNRKQGVAMSRKGAAPIGMHDPFVNNLLTPIITKSISLFIIIPVARMELQRSGKDCPTSAA